MSVERFRSMGCEVAVAGARPAELAAIRELFAERDRVFSRFRRGSELNRVNAARADVVELSPLFAATLREALRAAGATDGLVDPTLGAAILEAGYVADLDALPDDGPAPGPGAPGRWEELRLAGRLLRRTRGTLLDLNGVVKALAVDDAAALLSGEGFVSAGGDVATRGRAVVGVPHGQAVEIRGGIATSGTVRRRWRRGGALQHHLIDPGTGRPSRSPWETVTVCARSCLRADVGAKAAFLLGEAGPEWLDERGLAGRFVAGDRVVASESWSRALQATPC